MLASAASTTGVDQPSPWRHCLVPFSAFWLSRSLPDESSRRSRRSCSVPCHCGSSPRTMLPEMSRKPAPARPGTSRIDKDTPADTTYRFAEVFFTASGWALFRVSLASVAGSSMFRCSCVHLGFPSTSQLQHPISSSPTWLRSGASRTSSRADSPVELDCTGPWRSQWVSAAVRKLGLASLNGLNRVTQGLHMPHPADMRRT